MKHTNTSLILAAAVAIGVAGWTCRPASADTKDAAAEKPISVNMQSAGVVSVLKALFSDTGANYSIDADVQGTVSISMNNVGFTTALRSILRANTPALTFDYTDGVYHVRVRKSERIPSNQSDMALDPPTTPVGTSYAHTSSDSTRWYKLPIDRVDVEMLAGFIATQPATGTVPSGPSTGMSSGGSMRNGMGVGSSMGMGMGSMSGSNGMGMGMNMSMPGGSGSGMSGMGMMPHGGM